MTGTVMGWRQFGRGLTLVSLLLATACAGVSSEEPLGGDARSTASPTMTTPTPTPSGERPAIELWDNFGAPEGHEIGRYDGLGAMVRGAHAVVEGTVSRVDGREVYEENDPETALRGIRVNVDVIEVYKGDVKVGDILPTIVGLAELTEDVEKEFAALVGDRGIFFLIPGGAAQPEFGVEALPIDQRTGNWRPVTSQGVVIDDRGSAIFPMNMADQGFPAALDRIPFPELRNRVQDAAQK